MTPDGLEILREHAPKPLTWEELATIYDKQTGGHARTQLPDKIFDWAEKQTDKFVVDSDGFLCLIKKDDAEREAEERDRQSEISYARYGH